MANIAKTKSKKQDYPILLPFRLNGRWQYPKQGTIPLTPRQAAFPLLNGKIGKPNSQPVPTTQTVKKEAK